LLSSDEKFLYVALANADRVAVMYLGSIVESGTARRVFEDPQHPYTQALLSATLPADPTVHPQRVVLAGEIPSPIDLPHGCLFASRCPLVRSDCLTGRPADRVLPDGHAAACVRIDDGTNRIPVTPHNATLPVEVTVPGAPRDGPHVPLNGF